METLYYDVSQILGALSEASIKVCELQLFHVGNISFEPIFDLELRCLSWKSEAAINAVLIFNLFSLAGETKRCRTDACNEETSIHKFNRGYTLRTPFVPFHYENFFESLFLFSLFFLIFCT